MQKFDLSGSRYPIRELKGSDAIISQSDPHGEQTQVQFMSNQHLLGVIAHDLRTPLAGIRALAEYLLSPDVGDEEKDPVFLHQIHDQVVSMSMMLEDLLDYAQMDSRSERHARKCSTFALHDAAESAADAVRPLINHARVALEIDVTPDDLRMSGDRIGIERLTTNLLRNAQKNTEDGSICISICEHDAMIVIVVSDTGSGMPASVASRFGRSFVLATSSDETSDQYGAGLGLHICSEIIKAHGGCMHIASPAGQGTQVTVELHGTPDQPIAAEQQ